MARKPPLDLFTDKEREVASILLDVSSIISRAPFRWGRKRRRTEPPYEFKPEPDQPEPVGPSSSNEEKTKQEETASPVTPLCFPNSGSEEKIVTPPLKQIKKSNCQTERLKEKREEVAALTKEKDDLSRELQHWQERLRKLNARKTYLKDQSSKLSAAQVGVRALEQLKPVGPTQATNWTAFVVTPQWAPPLHPPPPHFQQPIQRPGLGLDLNVKLADDAAEGAEAAVMTCHSDREERAAKSALSRKRRLEIQRERRASSSSAHKRPRVR